MKKKSIARTPEQRENELIGLAVDLAEKKLKDGTASSQIITTLLNLASTKARLEIEKLRSDLKVADAKIEAMDTQKDVKELYEKALVAMKKYSGANDEDEEYYD